MGLDGHFKCEVCIGKAEATKDDKLVDDAYKVAYRPLFVGSVEIEKVLAFLQRHKDCGDANIRKTGKNELGFRVPLKEKWRGDEA